MKKREIIDCPKCIFWKNKKCLRTGVCGINRGKKGVCWQEPSESEY